MKQGFKKTDLGVIPEDWEVKSIGGEIDLETGFPFPSNKYTSTGIRLLRGSNIKRGKTDWSEEITEYWEKITFELEPYVLNEGDIVIAMDGSLVGRSFARLSKQDLPALLLQRVARIRSNKIDMGYLKEYICSDYFTRYCDSVKTVTAIPHISPEDIRKFSIPIPPTKEEQFAIAKILSETYVLIDSLDKLIEKKKNIKQGVMQKLLTGKKRLSGFYGEWVVKKLRKLADMTSGGTPLSSKSEYYGGKIPWVVITDMTKTNKYLDETEKTITEEGLMNSSAKLFKSGTLLFAMYASIGKCAIAKIDLTCNQAILGIVAKEIDSEYLFYYLTFYEKKYAQMGQTGAQKNLNKGIVQNFDIPYPPTKKEQISIAEVLSDMDEEIENLEQLREKYKQLKIGMMQQLLTGRIRLKWKN